MHNVFTLVYKVYSFNFFSEPLENIYLISCAFLWLLKCVFYKNKMFSYIPQYGYQLQKILTWQFHLICTAYSNPFICPNGTIFSILWYRPSLGLFIAFVISLSSPSLVLQIVFICWIIFWIQPRNFINFPQFEFVWYVLMTWLPGSDMRICSQDKIHHSHWWPEF